MNQPLTAADRDTARLAHDVRMACMRVSRRVRFESSQEMAPHHFSVLARLEEAPRTAGELAAIERVSPPSMTRTVAALCKHGLVQRGDDPTDRRIVLVSITRSGLALLGQERARRDAWMAVRLGSLSEPERAILRQATALLEQVVDQ